MGALSGGAIGGDDDSGGGRKPPDGTGSGRRMPVQQAVDVAAPVEVVYNQFTQFEEWTKFMHRVESASQEDEGHVTFKTKQWAVHRQWEAEITDQRPDERIAWKSTTGERHAGVVTFHRISDDTTRIMLQLDYEPEGLVDKAGDALGFVKRRAKGDLERFKELIENRGAESGAWRGNVPAGS